MIMYKLYNDPISGKELGIIRLADTAYIPFEIDNTDYQAYLKWLAEGNVPESAE